MWEMTKYGFNEKKVERRFEKVEEEDILGSDDTLSEE